MTLIPLPSTDEILDHLATTLAGLIDGDHDPAIALGVVRHDDGDIGLAPKALAGHPATELLGFTAPAEWWAFGVAARATARAWPDHLRTGRTGTGTDRAGQADEPAADLSIPVGARLTLVHLVTRDDDSWSRLVVDGGETTTLGAGSEGAIPDTCRRVLGLSTPPPAESTLRYTASMWLETVAAQWQPGDAWPEIAQCHPAVAVIAGSGDPIAAVAADHVVEIGRISARAYTWERLRDSWSSDDARHVALTADEMRWMDEGSFSRWCLGFVPPIADLVTACRELLPPRLGDRIVETLDAWELLDRSAAG